MSEQEALRRMVAPGTMRPGKYMGGIIQVHVCTACDKACCNCTQGSGFRGPPRFISLHSFLACVDSLHGWWGVVGVFGGNPALHPDFPELCRVLEKRVPYRQRGLWCNRAMGHGKLMREVFNPAVSNVNVHLDSDAADEFRRDWPEVRIVGEHRDSRHSPVWVSLRDVVSDEEARWRLIERCDINQHWSAMCGEFRGEPKGWFCEVAGAQSILHQDNPSYPDTGLSVLSVQEYTRGMGERVYLRWWELPMHGYREQVRKHCHECGVPLRGLGELATRGDRDQLSEHYKALTSKRKGRAVELMTVAPTETLPRFTDYLRNA